MIKTKRAYDPPDPSDGPRYLVDRLWPRGVKKETLQIQDWLKDVSPSTALRNEFHHDPQKWDAFCGRYFKELDAQPSGLAELLAAARQGTITLVYGARDEQHNNAVALKTYLEKKLG